MKIQLQKSINQFIVNNSQIYIIQIQMNPQDEFKRKYAAVPNYKTVVPSNNLINGKQLKKYDLSREKQDKKINIDNRAQIKISPHVQDQNSKVNPKQINFRNLKDTLPKKQATTFIKNPEYIVKPSMQYFPKTAKPMQQPHGISINVNIQNMLPQKHTQNIEPLALSDRSLVNDDKKNKKNTPINPPHKFDDFQCTQELIFKRTPIQKKSKISDKTIQKSALIDIKHHKIQVHQKPKDKILQIKQAIKKFQNQMQNINSTAQAEMISYLDHRQQSYLIPPDYIEKCQKYFSWKMRATLFQWMMHVSYEFSMKRQTFYIAVNLVDLFLSKQLHLPRSDFQLAGAASMFIASKIQQFQPKCSQQFAKATNTYSAGQVKQMQKRICKTLKYNLNPPTLYVWANRFMLQWDTFLQVNSFAKRHPLFAQCQPKYFKKYDDDSYKNYRTVMQLLDFASLEIQTVQYQPKLLVCAFMYLLLGKQMGKFKVKDITNKFPRSSRYLIDQENLLNDLFLNFLQTSFNFTLLDLLPAVQYAATFFILSLNFDDPITPMQNDDDISNVQFQDYCSYQTYNPQMKMAISKRFRGIYQDCYQD